MLVDHQVRLIDTTPLLHPNYGTSPIIWLECVSMTVSVPQGEGLVSPPIAPGSRDWRLKMTDGLESFNY